MRRPEGRTLFEPVDLPIEHQVVLIIRTSSQEVVDELISQIGEVITDVESHHTTYITAVKKNDVILQARYSHG